MKETLKQLTLASTALAAASTALATNGDNMIGVGPYANTMGGVGVAAPQDAISAVFANPAAMCFTPGCAYAEMNFAGSIFLPRVSAEVGGVQADGNNNVYAIPAIGLSLPIGGAESRWRFGLAAYGVTGLGVDYRGTAIDRMAFWGAPLSAGTFTSLQVMKFSPSLSYKITPDLSVGLAMQIDYETLDLGQGTSIGYSAGVQPGVIWHPVKNLSLGLTYISPQPATFDNVANYDVDAGYDSLKLTAPQQVGFGVAYALMEERLLLEANGRWVNWSDAAGYQDFGWKNQWVAALGAQFAVIPKKLFVRAGYNFGQNPVETHDFNGTFTPANMVNVQGNLIPRYYYETFRLVGFPAIVENHLTVGVGYAFSEKFVLNLGYTHAFQAGITENGTTPAGTPTQIRSMLVEDSFELGITWRF